MTYNNLLVSMQDRVGIIQMNRPEVLNALSGALMQELVDALEALDKDPKARCLILTGGDRAFAAGADIREMAEAGPIEMLQRNTLALWDRVQSISKPIIAAVSGYALGGGCELALVCDIIVAADSARFGQPEVSLGVIPGAGGTQRLARTLGKHRAMELVLTGRIITAQEALNWGLVSRVVAREACLDEAKKLAAEICERSPLAVKLAKETILKAFDTGLSEGLDFERKCFFLLFGTQDQKEGMRAFLEKRKPDFRGN